MNKRIELAGKRFGRLLVIAFGGHAKDKHVLWLCKCDCGREVIVRSYSLRKGLTRSCGCYNYDRFMANKCQGVQKGTLRGPYKTKRHTGIYSYLNKT